MADPIEELARDLGIRVFPHGALRLIPFEHCAKVVAACASGRRLILGIEAFLLSDGNVVPRTDLIADFSELASEPWTHACAEAARSAHHYFGEASGHEDLWFDFCLKDAA